MTCCWTVADELDSLPFVRQCISMALTYAGHRWYAPFCLGLPARTTTYILSTDPGKRVQQKRLRPRQWYAQSLCPLSVPQTLTPHRLHSASIANLCPNDPPIRSQLSPRVRARDKHHGALRVRRGSQLRLSPVLGMRRMSGCCADEQA